MWPALVLEKGLITPFLFMVRASNVCRSYLMPDGSWKGQVRAGLSCTLAWLEAAAQL